MQTKRWRGTVAATAVAALAAVGLFTLPGASAAGTVTVAAAADTYTQYDKATTNFGTSVRFSTEGRTNIWRHGLLRFNVAVPAGEKVVSAKVRAHTTSSGFSTLSASEGVDIYPVAGGWTETGVTWQNAPQADYSKWLAKASGFGVNTWVEWDVTAAVVNGENNFKLESNAQKWVGFDSKEAGAAVAPQLVVTTEPDTTPTPTPTPTQPPGDGNTAAAANNWGPVVTGDEFNYYGLPDAAKWNLYDGAGHAGNGYRRPDQADVNGAHLVIDGSVSGVTAGMGAKFDRQKYGRWETRAKGSGDNEYHMVGILWPDSENWPCDGEVDYFETTGDWNVINFFLHHGCDNRQVSATKNLDVSQWHNYAVDWQPGLIIGYVDGVEWFRTSDPAHMPPGPMHQTLQLDWFPDSTADGAAQMVVDWVRVYAAAGSDPTPTPTPTTTTAPPTGSVTLAAVGDMNPSGTTDPNSNSGKNAANIKAALASGAVQNFVGIGDFQYSIGHCGLSPSSITSNDHYSKYHANWGSFKAQTYWVAGPNHDIEPGRNDDLGQYMNGECVDTVKSATQTDPTRKGPNAGARQNELEWYSIDKGNWHILFAPTAVHRYNQSRFNAMTAELDADLAQAKAAGKHLAVVYHDPYFTSDTSSHTRSSFSFTKPWIDVFWKHRVKVLLSGSQHNYERTCPINNADQCVADGMQQFQVSTGGIGLRSFSSSPSFVQKRFSDTWGNLRLTLNNDGSYAWQFVPTSGGMQTDSGSRAAN